MTRSSIKRILAIGTITGIRSMSGAAAVAARHGGPIGRGVALLAAGEMAADKTAIVGDRTDPLPLAGRAIMGALLGGWIAREQHDSLLVGAVLGGATAIAATRSRHAFPAQQFEACAVHGAHQQAVPALEEFARRPVQATAGMRADVEPGPDGVAVAMQDQRFGRAVDRGVDGRKAAIGDRIQPKQRASAFCGRDRCTV